jgi:hypothetical protein
VAATKRQDTGVKNAAHGCGRGYRAIKDDGTGWREPEKNLFIEQIKLI